MSPSALPPDPPPAKGSMWIIEHSTGVFVRWRNYGFFKRPKFSWADKEEGYCFTDFDEARDNLTWVRRTHARAYLVELKPRRVRA